MIPNQKIIDSIAERSNRRREEYLRARREIRAWNRCVALGCTCMAVTCAFAAWLFVATSGGCSARAATSELAEIREEIAPVVELANGLKRIMAERVDYGDSGVAEYQMTTGRTVR